VWLICNLFYRVSIIFKDSIRKVNSFQRFFTFKYMIGNTLDSLLGTECLESSYVYSPRSTYQNKPKNGVNKSLYFKLIQFLFQRSK